jgi:uncharacterized protein YbaR (Trm112 family)
MSSETEILACPACRHLVRVPADWLGQSVQCPECQAKFQAPVREGDRLTAPVLLSPSPSVAPTPTRSRPDLLLTFPAFGLMLVGIAAVITNCAMFVRFVSSPDGGKGWFKDQMPEIRKMGFAQLEGPANQEEQDEQAATELATWLLWVLPVAALAGGVSFAGGLGIILRKGYRLAQVGCVLAALNIPNLCCVPGALFGLWGLLMLMSEEGREHFTK